MSAPLVSAIIPAYNAGHFIKEALMSILDQTGNSLEIIVVDDGSRDNTLALVTEVAPEAIIIQQDNSGPAAARNAGIAVSKGEWIAFLDADDQWLENKLCVQFQVLEKHPSLALIASDMAETTINGEVVISSVLSKHGLKSYFEQLDGAPIPDALNKLLNKNFIPTGTVIVRKEILLECGGFNPAIRYGEDLELWVKISARYPIACLPDVLMLRRLHADNATKATEAMLKDLVLVMSSLRAWDAQALRRGGIQPDRSVADAWADLGYWYFGQENLYEAKQAFLNSLREVIGVRSLFYLAASQLPARGVSFLRTLKQSIHGKG